MSVVNSTRQGNRFKHGHARDGATSREYNIWKKMKDRCRNQNNEYWKWYGGKGVTVCDRWSGPDGFRNFLSDMGPAPSPKHTIDRIKPSGNYEQSNCRWATRLEQGRNTSRNIHITHDGKTQCVQAWLDEFGISKSTYLSRLCTYGWSRERAATTPPKRRA